MSADKTYYSTVDEAIYYSESLNDDNRSVFFGYVDLLIITIGKERSRLYKVDLVELRESVVKALYEDEMKWINRHFGKSK